ncbi:MAG: pitrilysin family protein [Clostridia bacterium]|nr:pitrilysin family protein [Clostridia bacterium]
MNNSGNYFYTFDSGARLVVKEMKNMYSVSIGVFVNAGSRHETSSHNGYSHFIEHMLFKGTDRRTALEISQAIDDTGGSLNAYTSKDVTCFHTRTSSEHVELCMDVLSDMFFHATFNDSDIDNEKNVVLEEIALDEDMPDEVCQDLLAHGLFGNHPLGQTITGTQKAVESITRDKLIQYKQHHYTPNNVVISVVGNIDYHYIQELVYKYFETSFALCKTANQLVIQAPTYHFDFCHKFKDVEQCHVAMAFPSLPANHPLYQALMIMASIFGGNMSSRLFQSIREKQGLAYTVYSLPSVYADCGYFEIYCGTSPQKVKQAVQSIFNEIDNFLTNGATLEEFTRNKQQLLGGNKLVMESTMSVMRAMGSYTLRTNEIFDIDKRMLELENVAFEQVREVINMTFNQKYASAYVGKKIHEYDCISRK